MPATVPFHVLEDLPQISKPYQHQAFQDADQIFDAAKESVQVIKRQPHNDGVSDLERASLNNTKDVEAETGINASRKQHCFYVIRQNHSWSGLDVSLKSFHNIVSTHSLSDGIYDVVQAFRRRNSEIQQFRWNACHTHFSSPNSNEYGQAIGIQYPVRNHRNRGDPFSMRQIGVCQKNHGLYGSTWVILQPSREIVRDLESMLSDINYFPMHEENSMFLHLVFLSFQALNWDDYVEHLRELLEPLVEAAHFSRVDRSCKYPDSDYVVRMEECQNLQRFHWKLTKTLPVIDGNIAVLKHFKQCWEDDFDRRKIQPSIANVGNYLKQLEFQKESIRRLGNQAQRSADMLHKILEFRNSGELKGINAAMSSTLGILGEQARILTLLSEQRDKDSKASRALTSVATLYLPASLVATVFSSNIIQLVPNDSPREQSRFVMAPQPWLPVVVVLGLFAVTLISVRLLEKAYRYFK